MSHEPSHPHFSVCIASEVESFMAAVIEFLAIFLLFNRLPGKEGKRDGRGLSKFVYCRLLKEVHQKRNPQSSILNPQSSILNPRIKSLNPLYRTYHAPSEVRAARVNRRRESNHRFFATDPHRR